MESTLIIGVLNPKGGSGKTTLATNLAHALQLEGQSEGHPSPVLIVDTDPQGTATDWQAAQGDGADLPSVVSITNRRALTAELSRLSAAYDVVVIDGSAKTEGMMGAAVGASDVVVIPVQPSPADIWGAADLVSIIRRTGTLAAFVVSRQIVRTNLADEIAEALAGYELPVLEGRTSQRVAYAEAMVRGVTVLEGSDGKAAEEIHAITQNLLDLYHAQG